MLVVVHEVGWHWLQMDRWIKMQSSEEELCCSNDIVHQIRIIQMYIWLHNSQPVTNAVLERHREACQEHDIMFCVMIHGRDILFSIIHLPPLSSGSPYTFTVSIMFFAGIYQYIIW